MRRYLPLALLWGVILCRGILDIAFPRLLAYGIQLGGSFLVLGGLWYAYGLYFSREERNSCLTGVIYLFIACLSCFLTAWLRGEIAWGAYLLFQVYVIVSGLVLLRLRLLCLQPLISLLVFFGWVLLLVAIAEQLRLLSLSGESFVSGLLRPGSLCGSFLHYPIVMAIIALITSQAYQSTGRKRYLFSALCFSFAPFAAQSRSGMLIIIGGLSMAVLMQALRRPRLLIGALVVLGSFLALVQTSRGEASMLGLVSNRILNAYSKNAAGNSHRLYLWKQEFQRWSSTQLLLGEYAGMVTVSRKHLSDGKRAPIAESSVLQMMVNFGLCGMVCFYGLLFQLYFFIDKEHPFLRGALCVGCFQSLFYQSLEVIPYVILLFTLPWVSQCLLSNPVCVQSCGRGWLQCTRYKYSDDV